MVTDSENIDRRNFLGLMIGGAVMGAVDPKGLIPYVDHSVGFIDGAHTFPALDAIPICTGCVSNPIIIIGSGLVISGPYGPILNPVSGAIF